MPISRSYADLTASRPTAAAQRKPLLHTSPPRSRPLATEGYSAYASSPSSLSAIADSPRRLLSYYLNKAAYNTDEREGAQPPEGGTHYHHNTGYSATKHPGYASVTSRNEDDRGDDAEMVVAVPMGDRRLRPPPFVQCAPTANSVHARPALTHLSQLPSPRLPRQSPSPSLRSAAPVEKRVNFSLASEAMGDRSVETSYNAAPASTSEKAKAAGATSVVGTPVTEFSATQQQAHVPSYSPRTSATTTTASSVVDCTAYTAEQQRQYEAEIMSQVDALLQAQRSEWKAEVEAHRLAAQEAQATLAVIEEALAEQLGGNSAAAAAVAGARFSTSPSSPQRARHSAAPTPYPVQDAESLEVDMLGFTASAIPAATQRLLDAIMGIQDGHDVPSTLRQVVRSLFDELTRALVAPVMDFVQRQQPPRHAHAGDGTSTVERTAGYSESLVEAQAAIHVLQEEVMTMRRAMEARLSSGGNLPSRAAVVAAANAELTTPSNGFSVRQALLDRFFTECHASLTRSRQESLMLRLALEEERRQHFLTRLRLLRPSTTQQMSAAAAEQRRQDSAASPMPRSTTASRDQPPVPPVERSGSVAAASPASSRRIVKAGEQERGDSGHRWTPAPSPMAVAPHSAQHRREQECMRDFDDKRSSDEAARCHMSAPLLSPFASEGPLMRRTSLSADQPLRTPLLTAGREIEEVQRGTASQRGTVADAEPEHPYYTNHRTTKATDYSRSTRKDGAASEEVRRSQRDGGEPSVSFAEPLREDPRHASGGPVRCRMNDSTSGGAFARAAGTVTNALGTQPSSEYERRVWGKAVELLSRYSVA